MIAEVSKALGAYERLDSQGKRLFRDELGLVRPQQATRRRRRTKSVAEPAVATTTAVARRPRTAAATPAPVEPIPTADPAAIRSAS